MLSQPQRKSDLIRRRVRELFIQPAIEAGAQHLSVKVKDVLSAMNQDEIAASRTPMVCQVLTGNKILEENGLALERVDGPPSKQSRTVVVHYLVKRATSRARANSVSEPAALTETADEWAERVTSKIRGLMKDEIASFGGAEAFMKWVRSEDDEAA